MAKPHVLMSPIEMVGIKDLHPYKRNPRKGDVKGIAESLAENGQYRAIVVQKSTGDVLAGNHTLQAAISLGWKEVAVTYVDIDDDAAKKLVLVDNRLNDTATYDVDILTELLGSMPSVVGTGYTSDDVQTMLAAQMDHDNALVQSIIQPKVIEFEGSDEPDWNLNEAVNRAKDRSSEKFGVIDSAPVDNVLNGYLEKAPSKFDDAEELRTAYKVADIQKQLERLESMNFVGQNYWGIPELRRDMLEDVLPPSIKTWGGKDATTDDGVSSYIYNFGLASSSGLPWDRAIMATFTYDTKFESLLEQPAFQIAKMMNNGLKSAIVPDTSMWMDDPRINHLTAANNAQWMGRFMQEAGIKVIPRFMWCDLESIKYASLGIPKNPPIAAVCIQAIDKTEAAKQDTAGGLRMFVKEIAPDALIVYGGGTAKQVIADAKLPKSLHIVFVDNYASVRRHVIFDKSEGKDMVKAHQSSLAKEAKARGEEIAAEEAEELSEESV
jgi:ParB-like chromosome segregation protein Spo0J